MSVSGAAGFAPNLEVAYDFAARSAARDLDRRACFNEEKALRALHEALASTFGRRADLRCEFVLVGDGSHDRTLEVLAERATSDRRVTVVTLSRNFGQQASFSAGLEQARGHAVNCVMPIAGSPRDTN